MIKITENFINKFAVTKTVGFKAIPQGKTSDWLAERNIVETDKELNDDANKVKLLINDRHRNFIDTILSSFSFNESDLNKYYSFYFNNDKTPEERTGFKTLKKEMRSHVSNSFKAEPTYKILDKKDLICKCLPAYYANDVEALSLIKKFDKFSGYFKKFNDKKMEMYSGSEKHGTIAYRLIDQNFPKYLDNINIFKKVINIPEYEEQIKGLCEEIGSVNEYFMVNGFNLVLTQNGIDKYNTILGGISKEDGTKIKGLNEIINIYNQKVSGRNKIPQLKKLFKQILSISNSFSFSFEKLQTDFEVFDRINETYNYFKEEILETANDNNICNIASNIEKYDTEKIYIADKNLSYISNKLYGDWSVIENAVIDNYDKTHKKGRNISKYENTRKKEIDKIKHYPISFLNDCLEGFGYNNHIERYFSEAIHKCMEQISNAYLRYDNINTDKYFVEGRSLKANDVDKKIIQELLDGMMDFRNTIKPLFCDDDTLEKDDLFYGEFDKTWDIFSEINSSYNKIRNYLTSNDYSDEKFQINFSSDTFLGGWSDTKIKDNLGELYIKDGNYYLGVISRENKKWVDNIPTATSDNVYHKVIMRTIGSASKQLINPKIGKIDKTLPDDVKIDLAKKRISEINTWNAYNFKFKETSEYESFEEFCDDVDEQGYRFELVDVDADFIDSKVEDGSLYLFKLYCKDFSPSSHGKPNLHTLYFKELFSEENMTNPYVKILGGAHLYFRPASIHESDRRIHEANKPIKTKNALNPKGERTFGYDIIKDRRFTVDQFTFSIPLLFNLKEREIKNIKDKDFNNDVNLAIHDSNENVNIIGVDRGENNLVYVVVIDQDENILEQKSFNVIEAKDKNGNTYRNDYNNLLETLSKKRDLSRRDWTTIESIKKIKDAYGGEIAGIIARLVVKYNAIVVFEKLDDKFKRGRQKFEKQTYQNVEKAVTNKLNFFVDKNKSSAENGSVRNAYTLTSLYKDPEKVWQNGFMFYVPAPYTSKIDPTTGFVELFKGRTKYRNIQASKEFISRLDRVYFDNSLNMYGFDFDYRYFGCEDKNYRTDWTVYSFGNRFATINKVFKEINLTEEFDNLFAEYGITKTDKDMRSCILKVDKADFYERFMNLFYQVVKLRNVNKELGVDEIISPAMNSNGEFYVTGEYDNLPLNADANGSFCIARKGLMKIKQIIAADRDKISETVFKVNESEWFSYIQTNPVVDKKSIKIVA